MPEVCKTQAQRRAESNERIIDAAIRCFGELGYDHCSIGAVAKEAGVTKGLVLQRFQSKEALWKASFDVIATQYFPNNTDCLVLQYCLIKTIDRIKNLKKSFPEGFKFLRSFVNGSDPLEEMLIGNEAFMKRGVYIAVSQAQDAGIIPKGNIYNLLHAFLGQVINQVDICDKYSIPYPEDEYFLKILQIPDAHIVENQKRKEHILDAMCKSFTSLIYVYIDRNFAEIFRNPNSDSYLTYTENARESIKEKVISWVDDNELEKMLDFFDFDTIDERMKERSVLTVEFKDKLGRRQGHVLIPVRYKSNGSISELLIGAHIL